jgi:hypothetical protein
MGPWADERIPWDGLTEVTACGGAARSPLTKEGPVWARPCGGAPPLERHRYGRTGRRMGTASVANPQRASGLVWGSGSAPARDGAMASASREAHAHWHASANPGQSLRRRRRRWRAPGPGGRLATAVRRRPAGPFRVSDAASPPSGRAVCRAGARQLCWGALGGGRRSGHLEEESRLLLHRPRSSAAARHRAPPCPPLRSEIKAGGGKTQTGPARRCAPADLRTHPLARLVDGDGTDDISSPRPARPGRIAWLPLPWGGCKSRVW